jgi:hypothetical protein
MNTTTTPAAAQIAAVEVLKAIAHGGPMFIASDAPDATHLNAGAQILAGLGFAVTRPGTDGRVTGTDVNLTRDGEEAAMSVVDFPEVPDTA